MTPEPSFTEAMLRLGAAGVAMLTVWYGAPALWWWLTTRGLVAQTLLTHEDLIAAHEGACSRLGLVTRRQRVVAYLRWRWYMDEYLDTFRAGWHHRLRERVAHEADVWDLEDDDWVDWVDEPEIDWVDDWGEPASPEPVAPELAAAEPRLADLRVYPVIRGLSPEEVDAAVRIGPTWGRWLWVWALFIGAVLLGGLVSRLGG